MNRTVCCKHHLCRDCACEIMERIPAFRANYEVETVREVKPAPCPHCGNEHLRLTAIRTRDEARSYSDSPAVLNRTRGHTPGRISTSVQPSPLKVGDSMENMMRKMLTYEQCGINITAEQRISLVGDITTPGRDSPPPYDADLNNPSLPGIPFPPLPEDRVVSAHDNANATLPEPPQHEHGVLNVPLQGGGGERRMFVNAQDGAGAGDALGGSGALRAVLPVIDARGRLAGADMVNAVGRPPLPVGIGGGGGRAGSVGGSMSRSMSPLPPASPIAQAVSADALPEGNLAWEVHA